MNLKISWLWFLNFNYFKDKIESKEAEFTFLILKKELIVKNNYNLESFLKQSDFEKIFVKKEQLLKGVGGIYLGKIPFIFQNDSHTVLMKVNENIENINGLEIEAFSKKNDWEKKFKTQKDHDEFKLFLESFLNEIFFSLK